MPTSTPTIQHTEQGGRGSFFMERDGKPVGEMQYRRVSTTEVVMDHTEVHEVMRGLGVARKLLDAAAAWARQTNTKIGATCTYVLGQFEKDRGYDDVRSDRQAGDAGGEAG